MKKIISLFLTLVLLVSMVACGGNGDSNKTSVAFAQNEATLTVGESVNLKPTVIVDGVVSTNATIEYTLSNDKATVDANGNVTAVTAGNVILTATVDGTSAKITITINPKPSYQIILDVNGGDALTNTMINFTESDKVTLPTPTKEGYNFLGWYEGTTLVETVSSKNYVLVAKWEKQTETYTISYDAQGATLPSDVVTSFEENDVVVLPEVSKAGYNFLGWYEGETKVEQIENKNYELVAKFEAITYTISYTNSGNAVSNPTEYTIESETIVLSNPTKEGYNFLGWYEGEEKIEQIEKGSTKNYELVAKFEAITYTISYTNDGSQVSNPTEYTVETATITLVNPTKTGYNFLGWYEGEEKIEQIAKGSTKNYELVAKWEKIVPTYTISYDAQGATLPSDAVKSFKENEVVTLPVVSKEGYTFLGWYEGTEKVESITNKNYTLVAKWEAQTKNITYVLNDGVLADNAPKTFVVGEGAKLVNPTKAGSFFKGWFDNQACTGTAITEIATTVTKDVTLYACWEVNENTEGITYILNGGNTKYQNYDEVIADFLADISKAAALEITGSNFEAQARKNTFTAFLADDAMWAKWSWLFEFMASVNKNANSPQLYTEVLTKRTCNSDFYWFLTRDFSGFVNKKVGSFYYSVDPIDFTLYANADGYWHLIEEKYESANATSLLTPYRPYYKFEGWYDNEACEGTAVTTPVAGSVLYAKWSKQTAKITLVLNNNDATISQTEYNLHASETLKLETPSYDDEAYVFNGWYSDEACTKRIYEISEYTTKDTKVYASWSVLDGYTINYVLDGGNWQYATREEMVEDFLKDAMAHYNVSSKPNCMVQDGATVSSPVGFADKFSAIYGIFSSNEYGAKWSWLKQYIIDATTVSGTVTSLKDGNEAFWRYSIGAFLFKEHRAKWPISEDFTNEELANGFWGHLNAAQQTEFINNQGTVTLPTPIRQFYTFGGWYKSSDFSGSAVTTVSSKSTLYAKWVELTPVESVTITNKVDELKNKGTYQLEWTLNPTNAAVTTVSFKSSDTSVATVNKNGLITAVGAGTVTITIISDSHSKKSDSMSFNVYNPDFFEVSYETNSHVEIGGQIALNAVYTARDGSNGQLTWSSLNSSIATVNASGVVTGVSAGVATIRATVNGSSSTYFDFPVTVLSANASNLIKHIANANESNIYTRYNLGIGAGTPAYYADIYGSINKILFNDKLNIDNTYLATGNAAGNNSGTMSSVVFITVHYTGNMGVGADAEANAKYFVGSTSSSIHYTTGNDGVYHCMDDNKKAWHAGTGNSFTWTKTEVQAKSTDPKWPVWGINSSSYFTINGISTGIKVPNETTRGYGYVKDSKWLNDMGLAWKVEGGYYYMGNTHWHYKQVYEGRICSAGGNNNSIGIESCVDKGSDLWYTWQKTAQLVAQLMVNNNLGINRVVGHHFFTAKDCPQPMLENDKEIWWEFLELVEAEHALLTTYKGATITMALGDNYSFVNNKGRITAQPEFSQIVKYTVNVTFNGVSESIVLASAVNGIYTN